MINKLDARFETHQSLRASVDVEAGGATLEESRALCRRAQAAAERFRIEHREVAQVIRFIDRNLHSHLTLEEIARQVNLSIGYLCRMSRQETGLSVIAYINPRRMRRAAELLRGGGLSVKAAALSVGIEDQRYFSRLFRKTYPLSPSECRFAKGAALGKPVR